MTKNTQNSFAVLLPSSTSTTSAFYKKGLLDELKKYPWLTVDGQNPPPTRSGIDEAGPGNLITFGTADKHDVSWIRRPDYARERGIDPIYDLVKDWNTVVGKLKAFADSKKPKSVTLSNGATATFHKNYVKVGYNAYPYANVQIVLSNADVAEMFLGRLF